ncbi:MAG: HK97 family phage prohead protease, partial [Pseudomonadota bacterium]
EDAKGLHVSGELLAGVAKGRDAIALVQAGAIDGLSIGYRTLRAAPDPETGGRRLIEIDLWEVSLVTFPMLLHARIGLTNPPIKPLSASEAMADALADVLGRA